MKLLDRIKKWIKCQWNREIFIEDLEFKEPKQGPVTIYTYEIYDVLNKKGDALRVRLAFDEEQLFVRSAEVNGKEVMISKGVST